MGKKIREKLEQIKLLARNRNFVYYVIGFLALTAIFFEGIYLLNDRLEKGKKEEKSSMVEEQKGKTKKEGGMTINFSREEGSGRALQKLTDSGFEAGVYGNVKNFFAKNAEVKISKEKFHAGKNSLQVDWKEGKNKFVQLNNYFSIQKDKYYKIGLWISSAESGNVEMFLVNSGGFFSIANVGVVANEKNNFSYYEYNFRSPADASTLEFFVADGKSQTVFIDDIKLVALPIDSDEELVSIKPTLRGINQADKIGESQNERKEYSNVLSQEKTLFGQVFSSSFPNLSGISLALSKKGDGGIGNYSLELREFDEISQTILPEKIASRTFTSQEIDGETKSFQLFANLQPGKKYWIGLDNSGAKVNPENYLAVGQASGTNAYSQGDGFLQRGENMIFTAEKDLCFSTTYLEPIQAEGRMLAYGETLYDLGGGKSLLEYNLDPATGSNILDIYRQNNIKIDKWKNIALLENDSQLVYKIPTGEKQIEHLILSGLSFHNNIQLALSDDGERWTEIFSDVSGKQWQNSGRIEIDFDKDTQDILFRLKRNGEQAGVFLGGYVILELEDKNYDK